MKALLSVYDKTGVVAFAAALHELGWELLSSGGTARAVAEAGVPVTDVAELTGFPAILGHRVVTLHPKVHGGLLADRNDPEHIADMEKYGIEGIDLVVANLYPFSSDPSIDLIDIGGPAMVRAAAKNHEFVGIVTDPSGYGAILDELRADGSLSLATRRRLARAAYATTSAYDAEIVRWLDAGGPDQSGAQAGAQVGAQAGDQVGAQVGAQSGDQSGDQSGARVGAQAAAKAPVELPASLEVTLERKQVLRYGENPHQVGARYSVRGSGGWWDTAIQHGGKEMSYLNVYDTEAAWRLVHELGAEPAAVVIKHANPCGVAIADDISTAYTRAHECDPVSAFGGVVAVNRPVTVAMAEALAPVFTEVLVAPGFEADALLRLLEKRNLRILEAQPPGAPGLSLRTIDGGYLVQTPDVVTVDRAGWSPSGSTAERIPMDEESRRAPERKGWRVVTKVAPTEAQWADLELAWRVVAKVTSNSIVLVKDLQAFGIGCGQQNRRDAGRLACEKAEGRAVGGVYASDAFFPFADGLDGAVDAGAAAIIEPGGSIRDEEVIARADEAGLAMVFTGERHFRH